MALRIFNPPLHLVNIVSRAAIAFNYPQFRNFPRDAAEAKLARDGKREKKLKAEGGEAARKVVIGGRERVSSKRLLARKFLLETG